VQQSKIATPRKFIREIESYGADSPSMPRPRNLA
jgi:hypothetical protein